MLPLFQWASNLTRSTPRGILRAARLFQTALWLLESALPLMGELGVPGNLCHPQKVILVKAEFPGA